MLLQPVERPHVILSDHELAAREHEAAALHLQALDRDMLDPRVVNGDRGVYNWFRKEAYRRDGNTRGRVSCFKLGKALYPDVATPDDARRKYEALRRRLRRLQAAGVLEITEHQGLELEWQLVARAPDPDAWPDLREYSARRYPHRAGPCSSTGEAANPRRPGCDLKARERLHRAHPARRVHRWNPRIGRGSEHRYDVLPAGSPSLFSPRTFGWGGSPPVGLASLDLRAGDGVKPAVAHEPARPPTAGSDAGSGHQRDVTFLQRSPDAGIAGGSIERARPGTAPRFGPGPGRSWTPSAESWREADLVTRSWINRERWAFWSQNRLIRLRELAELRYPSYADIAEAFGLAVAGGGPDAPDGWPGHSHARQATREALEREAARYDRYAGRLAAEHVELEHPTALHWLIGYYLSCDAAEIASPGAALSGLTRRAKTHRRAWNARHPDVLERRRRERAIRRAEQQARFAESHLGFDYRRPAPRRRRRWESEC